MVQHCCVMHSQAYCNQNAVMNRCSPNCHAQRFNNKSEHSIWWHLMCLFLQETHYIVFPHCIINLQHNPNLNTHSNVNYNDFDIDYFAPESLADQPLNNGDAIQVPSLKNAPFSEIQYGFRLILPFKFIWCLKWMNTNVMIWTCSMKS